MIYNRRLTIKKSDILFSKYIRNRDKECLHCHSKVNLQCSHIIPRQYLHTRFDPNNGLTLCYRCHIYWWHKEPNEAARWLEQLYPGRYDELNAKRNLLTKVDIQGIYEDLKGK